MNNIIVLFESKYGFTKRYATWIAEALSCPLFEKKEFHPQDFKQYDTIVYGGGLYAGSVSGIKLLIDNWNLIHTKNIILFTCGFSNPNDPSNVTHIKENLKKTLSSEMLEKIHFFHFQGGIDYSKLSFKHKLMMSMLRKMLLKKDIHSLREEDKKLLETYGEYIDFTDRASIYPLINCALSY